MHRIAEYLDMNVMGALGVYARVNALSLFDSFQDSALAIQHQAAGTKWNFFHSVQGLSVATALGLAPTT